MRIHNHVTRDIKPLGQCPACDKYHERHIPKAAKQNSKSEIMKIKTKPVLKEATRFMGGFSFDEMSVEWGKPFISVARYYEVLNYMEIKTLEGISRADVGDYIIRGLKGEFYPCKPDIFEETYEPA